VFALKNPKRILVVYDSEAIHTDFKNILIQQDSADIDGRAGELNREMFGSDKEDAVSAASQVNYVIDDAYQGEEAILMSDLATVQDLEITLNSIGDAVIDTDIYRRVTRMNPVAGFVQKSYHSAALSKAVSEAIIK